MTLGLRALVLVGLSNLGLALGLAWACGVPPERSSSPGDFGGACAAGFTVPLARGDEFSAQSLIDWDLPVEVGFLDRFGLSALLSGLGLADGFSLEAGVTGLDGRPAGVFLLSLAQPTFRATVGRSRLGPQADVLVETPLAPWLRAIYGIQNRHWPDADFLHEGYFRLEAAPPPLSPLGDDELRLGASALLAASNQTLSAGPVTSSRSTVAFGLSYRTPPLPVGQWSFVQNASYSRYPQANASQYGLRLRPSWTGRFGPLTLSLDYDLQLTDSGSPFSTRLDRLQPINLLAFSALLRDERPGFEGSLTLHGRYNLLSQSNPWRRLELLAAAGTELSGWSVRPRLVVEVAGLLSPFYDPEVEAYVAASLDLARGGWAFGFDGRYAFVSRGPGGLERLELSASLPLRTPEVRVQPFLALDAAPLLSGRGGAALSGHGLELEWETCCGRLTLGYRLHQGRFTTNVGLDPDPAP